MKELKIPEIALVLLVGPSSSGKSTFVRSHFIATEVISSDYCRALVSDDENSLEATDDAFEILHAIAAKRLKRGKLTVIDALNVRKEDRARFIQLAKDNYALATALVLETPIRTLFDRHITRTDRNFGGNVLERQHEDFKRSLRSLEKEGFSHVHYISPGEEISIVRQKLWNNRKEDHGPFDIIGDIHRCFDELMMLVEKLGYAVTLNDTGHYSIHHPANRKLLFLGDLTDRRPKSPEVLRFVMDTVKANQALCILGNHDDKLHKFLSGKNVSLTHGLEKTAAQMGHESKDFLKEVKDFLYSLIAHYVLDDGKLVVAHAGLPEPMHGRASAIVRAFSLFGETTGEVDKFGLPVRHDWAEKYKGKALVVYGHTPVPVAEWINNSVNIDTGCVFGGELTALRYPEREILSVKSLAIYSEPIKPLIQDNPLPAEKDETGDLIDVASFLSKNMIETQFDTKVIIREDNAAAALEVMSRFALNPKWLIYLPPTMSPPETSSLPGFLEHPQQVFDYYSRRDVKQVICEEKHMGSRAIAVVLKDPSVARSRFGFLRNAPGTIYTRTGRNFFENDEI